MALTKLKDNQEFHVVANEPQLIGYTFCNEAGDRLGDVDDLIADTDAMKVRFLVVALDQGLLTSRRIIVPLRDVAVDAEAERVVCANCSEERLQTYPTYAGGALPELEKRFTATFLPRTGAVERPAPPPPHEGVLERAKERVGDAIDKLKGHEEPTVTPPPSTESARPEGMEGMREGPTQPAEAMNAPLLADTAAAGPTQPLTGPVVPPHVRDISTGVEASDIPVEVVGPSEAPSASQRPLTKPETAVSKGVAAAKSDRSEGHEAVGKPTEGGHKHEGGCCGSLEAIDEGGVVFERRRDLPPL